MKLRLSAALLVLFTAFPTLARVLSYAPYTNNVGFSAFHERTTRHFLVMESPQGRGLWDQQPDRTLVLHDTQGGEPRVLLPPLGTVRAAALYESRASIGVPPVILAVVSIFGGTRTVISSDGGTSWKEVTALSAHEVDYGSSPIDLGGPWVQGLNPAIRIGNDTWPFIVQSESGGVFAVAATGDVKLVAGPHNTVHGQNAAGSKLLIAEPSPVGTFLLKIVDVEGGTPVYLNGFALTGSPDLYEGWISAGNTVYIVADLVQGRFLYRWQNGQSTLIAGSRGAIPPPIEPLPERDPLDFIAVPTNDFDGAWMVQRGSGEPTTLLRYTPASGLETLWSDPSGAEVEALIAGPSGQSVLIQVHRHRRVVEEIPFTTPALAVWKLGEPMPREYHELYVNEEQDKGFIHVNPDTMREGSTFVFNSGLGELPDDPRTAVIEEWGVVLQSSLKQHLILPGVARLQGGFGSEWRTDVTMYNPLDTEQSVDIEYVPMYEAASSPRTVTLTLKAHEVRFVSDALQALFLLETGGGSLHFRPADGINVAGRTYSHSGNGTYGFGMTAIDAINAAGPRLPMTFAGAFPGEHFRTNVLLTDTSGRGTAATLSAFGAFGSIGSGSVITAEAGGTSQFNGVHGSLNILQRDAGGLVIQPTRGTAIATVVAIDNRTNDPTWFPPDLTAVQTRTIPVIGHLSGANGSQFRSDLYLFNPSHRPQTVVLEGKKWDSADRLTRQFTLRPREARVIVDALHSLWNEEGVARLRYRSIDDGEGVRVTSRTYTIDESGATYGSLIPPLDHFQIAPSGDALEIIGATAGPGFRTNVGLVELSDVKTGAAPTTVRIRVIDQDHHELDSFTVTLQRAAGVQINNIFASRGITPPAAALIVVEVLDEGLIGAYATLTDNTTNDTTYLAAQLAAKAN
jgi:hypothetical protein